MKAEDGFLTQEKVLETIREFFQEEGRPPCQSELNELFGMHRSQIHVKIRALERRGELEKVSMSVEGVRHKTVETYYFPKCIEY